MNNETVADIVADLRARADRAEAAVGFPTVESENDRRLADRIEAAAERERNRQYEPKCDWSIREARQLANTLANHGLRDGNADAASSCIYSLCRALSALGNTAAMRKALTGRDMAAARGAIDDLISDCNAALSSETSRAKDIHIRVAKSAAKEAWSKLDNLIRAAIGEGGGHAND